MKHVDNSISYVMNFVLYFFLHGTVAAFYRWGVVTSSDFFQDSVYHKSRCHCCFYTWCTIC